MRVMDARRSVEPYVGRMQIVPPVFCLLVDENFDVMTRAVNVQTKLSSAKYAQATVNA